MGCDNLSVHVSGVWLADGDENVGLVEAAGGAVEGERPAGGGRREDDRVAWGRGLDRNRRAGVGLGGEPGPISGARGEEESGTDNPKPFHAGTGYTD